MSPRLLDLSELSLEDLLELRAMCQRGSAGLDISGLRLLQSHIALRKQLVNSLETLLSKPESDQAA